MITSKSGATVRVKGCCWRSAVQEPQPVLLVTTVPPRCSTGTWKIFTGNTNHIGQVGFPEQGVYCTLSAVWLVCVLSWSIDSPSPESQEVSESFLLCAPHRCWHHTTATTQNHTHRYLGAICIYIALIMTLRSMQSIRPTSSDPGSKILTVVTPGSVTGQARSALPEIINSNIAYTLYIVICSVQ